MEEKKKSTFGKAFSRTFSRKTPAAAPPGAVAPAAAPASAPAMAVDALPSKDAVTPASVPAGEASPLSPISIPSPEVASVTPPVSTDVSHATSPAQVPHNDSPMSPTNHSMHPRDGTGLSNASTVSRQGLAGEDGEGLNPADILLNRLAAFRGVVKNLQKYFTEVAQVETGVSKALNKASGVIVVPFKDGQQFLGKGGLQDVCIGIRDSAKTRSDQHASSARFVEETIVKNLRRLKQDIKARVKTLKADSNLYSNKVFKEREATQEKIASLAKAIGLYDMSGQHQPDMEKMGSDPYVINLALKRQLAKQVNEENLFARALKQCQEEIKTFEAHTVKELKQILASFSEYQATDDFNQSWAPTQTALDALQEDSEWTNFLERHGHRLFPSDLVDTNPEDLAYPCKDSPYVIPVKTAHLSRKSSVLKSWKDEYFVLTLAGWLHIFGSADLDKDSVPEHSIFIPTATLGAHAEAGQKQHVFSLDGKGKGGLLHKDTQTVTLRANSREEMLEWWSEISKRAHSSTFKEPGDGSISRSASVMRSSSVIQPTSPDHGPSPPYVAQAPHDEKAAIAAPAPAPATAPAPEGSTASVDHASAAPAAAPVAAAAP